MSIEPSTWAYAASEQLAQTYPKFDVVAAAYTIDELAVEPAIVQLRASLARVTAELEHHKSVKETLDSAHKELSREHAAIRARVAELDESLHLANGTADLALHHRDIAEQRNAELAAALEELYETANRFPTFDGSRLASALDSASAALARNRAAQEASK